MFTFTNMAIDYSIDELDDLTDRKVAPEGIDGDQLARIVRTRRGVARATLSANPFWGINAAASRNLWGDVTSAAGRRMVAVGMADEDGTRVVRYLAADGSLTVVQHS